MARADPKPPAPSSPRFHLQKAQWENRGRPKQAHVPEWANWPSAAALEHAREEKLRLEDEEPYNVAAVHRLESEAAATRFLSRASGAADSAQQQRQQQRQQQQQTQAHAPKLREQANAGIAEATVRDAKGQENIHPPVADPPRTKTAIARSTKRTKKQPRKQPQKLEENEGPAKKKDKRRNRKRKFKWHDYTARTSHYVENG